MKSNFSRHSYSQCQSNHRKTHYALLNNTADFVSRHGLDKCGTIDLTFAGVIPPVRGAQCMKKAVRLFHNHFTDWIWTAGIGKKGRLHYHVLFATTGDIRTGIDPWAWRALGMLDLGYDEFSSWKVKGTTPKEDYRKELRTSLSSNGNLNALRKALYPKLKEAGFGHQIYLNPIFTDAATVSNYLAKNYMESVLRRTVAFRGHRLTGYKKGAERLVISPFAWVSNKSNRDAASHIGKAFGVDYPQMKVAFGPKWGYRMGFLMAELQSHYGKCPSQWPVPAIVQFSTHAMPKITEISAAEDFADSAAAA